MKVLSLVPLILILAACSSVKVPTPYRIDVQQGNALEQESVEKLKVGLTRSQVRFLLGTPLVVDPFHKNRWDYVYNYRKAGKLTEERRLALFFDGDVLARIEAEGFAPKGVMPPVTQPETPAAPLGPSAQPAGNAAALAAAPLRAVEKPAETARPSAETAPLAAAKTVQAVPAPDAQVQPAAPAAQPKPVPEPAPVPARKAPESPSTSAGSSLNETSIVAPLQSEPAKLPETPKKPAPVRETPPEAVSLQPADNVAAIKPAVMPEFPNTSAASSTEEQIVAAVNAWAAAWRSRDEDAYLAAYAANFRPDGGQSREEWEKRRRMLLGVSRNIDLQIDGIATEVVTEDRAQVSFRQFYRSESYQDAVIKQLKFVRVDNLWLIEEEKVLAPIKVKK